MGISAFCYIRKLFQCSAFPGIYCLIGGRGGVSLPYVYMHTALYETFSV